MHALPHRMPTPNKPSITPEQIAAMKRATYDTPNPHPERILSHPEILATIHSEIQAQKTNLAILRKMRQLGVVWTSDEILRTINEQRKVLKMPESRLYREDRKATLTKRFGLLAGGFGFLIGGLLLTYATEASLLFIGLMGTGLVMMLAGAVSLLRSFW